MTALGIATGGYCAGAAGLATVYAGGAAPEALPPLFTFPIPVPPRRAHERLARNPRVNQPGTDHRLHLSDGRSLVDCAAGMLDEGRQALVDAGLRYYEVFSIVVRWSGGERHRGDPRVIFEQPFLPVPRVKNVGFVDKELRAAGQVARGDIKLEGISARYTVEQIATLFPGNLQAGDEHFIEVRGDKRDGAAIQRQRYVVSGRPERGAFGWSVKLTSQDESRTQGGRPR